MAISTYDSECGKTLWKIYVNVRSKTNTGIRAQRRVNALETEREAKREETRLIRECEREIAEKESRGSNFGAVVERFEEYLALESLHSTTKSDYIATVRKHAFHWWPRVAAQITKAELKEFFSNLKSRGVSVGHIKKMKIIINKIFVFGMDSGLIRGIDRSPTVGIALGSDVEKKPEILTITEIRKLLESAKGLDHAWYPVWALALLTGMRNGELYALTWDDVDFENSTITVSKSYNCRMRATKSTKAGYWRAVPISVELNRLLQDLKANAGKREWILPRFYKWTKGLQAKELRKFCLGVGLPSVRFHALRACFATQLIRNGVPPIQIQKICGWRDLKTMQRYIRLAGIEIIGATEGLRVLPEDAVMAQAGSLFT